MLNKILLSRMYGLLISIIVLSMGCDAQDTPRSNSVVIATEAGITKVVKSPEVWKEELSKTEYYILREAGTEQSFSGDLWDFKEDGTYVCRGCQLPLFSSDTKFKSGTGWPSYYKPYKKEYVTEIADSKYGWKRVEVVCTRCDGHLGHVFNDGPAPTGLRYCINSASLDFVDNSEELEAMKK